MNTIFMSSENSKKSDPHSLLFNLRDKIDLRRKYKCIALSNLSMEKYKKLLYMEKYNKFI